MLATLTNDLLTAALQTVGILFPALFALALVYVAIRDRKTPPRSQDRQE